MPTAFRSVRDEIRENLIDRLEQQDPLFPDIVGYEDSVIPALVNALLAKHNIVLLGLRGQAKSRILRSLVNFLDEETPVVAGCEIRDDPFFPICSQCRKRARVEGDKLPIRIVPRSERFIEKLATPDVTIADIIGDLDPIKAATQGTALSAEENIHFGLLPRAHRGIFSVNELPDLAPKIQVGLFNIMQEGDVQIKGFPVRLPIDVLLVFSANPEDYTARGRIVTPLKDRIGSEIRTHYPLRLEDGIRITRQECWVDRSSNRPLEIPDFIHEIIEGIAFLGRKDQRIDRRSGVSQRLPITCLEVTVSNAERRALVGNESRVVPRISDVYASIPAITGKLELEYEGELKGADTIAGELIQLSVLKAYARRFPESGFANIVQWFDLGGELKVSDETPAREYYARLKEIQGLGAALKILGVSAKKSQQLAVSSMEFVLEGLCAQGRLSRNQEKGYFKESEESEEQLFADLSKGSESFN